MEDVLFRITHLAAIILTLDRRNSCYAGVLRRVYPCSLLYRVVEGGKVQPVGGRSSGCVPLWVYKRRAREVSPTRSARA